MIVVIKWFSFFTNILIHYTKLFPDSHLETDSDFIYDI